MDGDCDACSYFFYVIIELVCFLLLKMECEAWRSDWRYKSMDAFV